MERKTGKKRNARTVLFALCHQISEVNHYMDVISKDDEEI